MYSRLDQRSRWLFSKVSFRCPAAYLSTTLALFVGGCAAVGTPPLPDVQQVVQERTGARVYWRTGAPEDAEVDQSVAALLRKPLTADSAVQITLLNNAGLQAEYESLGIAQADLVQAGLLSNPVFGASVRFSDAGGKVPNWEFNIVQNFLDLLIRPARQELAEGELERTTLRVSNAVLALSADVESAYYRLLGAGQLAAIRRAVAEAAGTRYDLARRFDAAGNLSELDLAREAAAATAADIDLARGDAEVAYAREQLNRLLGLSTDETRWTVDARLPAIPAGEFTNAELEQLAIAQRLDLAAARKGAELREAALATTRAWRYLGNAEVGVDAERESDGERLIGPNLTIELPIFDQHQANIARAESERRAAAARAQALESVVRSEVRGAQLRVAAQRELAERFRTALIPARERVIELAQAEQSYMLIGVFEVLAAQRDQFDAYREYIESVRDYWIARADLTRAVGGRLPTPTSAVVPLQLSPPAMGTAADEGTHTH